MRIAKNHFPQKTKTVKNQFFFKKNRIYLFGFHNFHNIHTVDYQQYNKCTFVELWKDLWNPAIKRTDKKIRCGKMWNFVVSNIISYFIDL